VRAAGEQIPRRRPRAQRRVRAAPSDQDHCPTEVSFQLSAASFQMPEMSWETAIRSAHEHCIRHRLEVMKSDVCGCFHCLAIYSPSRITEWVDEEQTALCAECGIDSVIGDRSGFPIAPEFLAEMKRHWFS